MDCSVVISCTNEYPQVTFTVQNIIEELEGFCDYEILVVDNLSTDHTKSFFTSRMDSHVKYLPYGEKQSHWCAKTYGVNNSKGKCLFFPDAHIVMKRDSLRNMFTFLEEYDGPVGSVHSYHTHMNMYRPMEYELKFGKFMYRFRTAQKDKTEPYKVGVMTTDCMMCRKSVFDELGAWHPEFGIRTGGEAYMMFKQGTCGYPHFIHPKAAFHHLKARKYGYRINYHDITRNNFIAAYICGGDKWLDWIYHRYVDHRKITKERGDMYKAEMLERCNDEMEFVKSKQVMSLDQYFKKWSLNLEGTGDQE